MAEEHFSKKFDYSISDLGDVVEHLDKLWDLHNRLAQNPADGCCCTDPPNCTKVAHSWDKEKAVGSNRTP